MGKETAIKFSTYQRATELIKSRLTKINESVEALIKVAEPLSLVQQRNLATLAKEAATKRSEFEKFLQRVLESVSVEEASNDLYLRTKMQSAICILR